MEEIVFYKNEEVYLSDKFFKYNSKTYSIDIINGTDIKFHPLSKSNIWFCLLFGISELTLGVLLKWDGFFLIWGIVISSFSVYHLFAKKYTLKIKLSNSKATNTVVSKDINYLKEIDNAFQLAFNQHSTLHQQK